MRSEERGRVAAALGDLWRRGRALAEQVLFGTAGRALDPRDVQSYYRVTDG